MDFKIIDNQRFSYSTKVDQPAMTVGFVSPVSHRTAQNTTAYLSEALKKERQNEDIRAAVTEVLREIDPGVERFEIIDSGRSSIFIKRRDTGMTPLSAYGDGMRRALLLAAMIPAVSDGVLLIDEIETALHVNVLDSVLRVLRWAADQYNVQVFATTHSLEAVDGALNGYEGKLEQLVGYRLSHEEGESGVTRYTGELLQRIRYERGLEIR